MSEAISVSVAKEVTRLLAAGSFSQVIAPERSYADWEKPLEADDDCPCGRLLIDVVANTAQQRMEMASRGVLTYTMPVDIAIRKRFGAEHQSDQTGRISVAQYDAMALLTQEIHEYCVQLRLTDFDSAVWRETMIVVSPNTDHLRQMRQWTSVVRVTFDARKAAA